MKTLALVVVLVSACTRTVYQPAPASPGSPAPATAKAESPKLEFHAEAGTAMANRAASTFLRSKSGQGAKCDPIVTTAVYDDAFCELPNGAQLVCWHEQPGGFGCYGLYSPPPQQPPQAPPEAPKKK